MWTLHTIAAGMWTAATRTVVCARAAAATCARAAAASGVVVVVVAVVETAVVEAAMAAVVVVVKAAVEAVVAAAVEAVVAAVVAVVAVRVWRWWSPPHLETGAVPSAISPHQDIRRLPAVCAGLSVCGMMWKAQG
jgi:hypothetical protein